MSVRTKKISRKKLSRKQSKQRSKFKKAAKQLLEREQETESCGESKHQVVRYKDPFWNNVVVVKSAPRGELDRFEHERMFAQFKPSTQTEHEQSCTPIGTFCDTERSYYVMAYEDSPTLAELVEKGEATQEHFQRAFDFMNKLHTEFPLDGVLEQERDLEQTLEGRLSCIPDLKPKFLQNLAPIKEALRETPRVARVDGHVWNWTIDENKITRLDTENTRVIPIVLDWANLLDHVDYLTPEQKLEVIPKECALEYHNAVCARALELYKPLSERPTKKRYRRDWIDNSLSAIDQIELNHHDYFTTYHTEYTNLRQAFQELKAKQ